jgi:hypothetical protein
MNGWQEKFLSHAGKEILLKAMLQAIPTYTMSVFQLPKTLCREINSLMAKLWWGHKENTSKIAWSSWPKLGRSRDSGGLGYRDLEMFNLALLAKHGWRFIHHPESLVAKVFSAKYFPRVGFLESQLGQRPSFAWRSTWNSKIWLKKGLMWQVGIGEKIRIWRDKWLPNSLIHGTSFPSFLANANATINELIN